jgi:hypothetical protein
MEWLGMLAKQVLSQLSYTPTREAALILKHFPPFRIPILPKIVKWTEPYSETVFVGTLCVGDLLDQ